MVSKVIAATLSLAAGAVLIPLCGLIAVIFICVLTPMPASTSDGRYNLRDGYPTDQQLTDNYNKHKTDFESLAKMLETEAEIYAVDKEGCYVPSKKEDPTLLKKCDEYRKLLRRIGLIRILASRDPNILEVASSGLGVSGGERGYMYTKQSKPIPPSKDYFNLRQMDGYWWIYDFAT